MTESPAQSMAPDDGEANFRAYVRQADIVQILAVLFAAAAAFGCLDKKILNWEFLPFIQFNHMYYWILFGFLAWIDREPPLGRRILVWAAAMAFTFGYGYHLRHLTDHFTARRVIEDTVRFGAIYAWALAAWFAAPVLADWKAERYSRPFWLAAVFLFLYGAICFATAVSSASFHNSLEDFAYERAMPLGLAFAWMRFAAASARLRAQTARNVFVWLAVLVSVGALIGIVSLFSGADRLAWMAGHDILYLENSLAHTVLPRVRLIFPLQEFNRASYFGVIATMVFFVGFFQDGKQTRSRKICLCLIAAGLLYINFTYTRGAMVAAAFGLCFWAAWISRRALVAIVVVSAMLVVFAPASKRAYIQEIFRPKTYMEDTSDFSSPRRRIIAWQWAFSQIAQHPLTGLGFGYKITEDRYGTFVKESREPINVRMVRSGHIINHMHNVWIETAVQSGLPALLALMLFTLARWALLMRAFLRQKDLARGRVAAWMALEFAILTFGMYFYMLKDNPGYFTWLVWAHCLAEMEAVNRDQSAAAAQA